MRSPLPVTALLACLACAPPDPPPDDDEPPRLRTPPWAFEPWISKDISDRDDTYEFLEGFRARDIPVGVVVLDSPWETNYNTFVPSEERYPGFDDMVRDFAEGDVRVVLWVTQMINYSSFDLEVGGDSYDGPAPNLQEAAQHDYLVNDGETYLWWKGEGAALDFFNDEAVWWWHRQQNALLDAGVAGWKLDFGEQYITTTPIKTAAGDKTLQEYSEEYYRDFWEYGARRRGSDELITMVRAYDESYGFAPRFYAKKEHAPVAWMGDNTRDFAGLVDALDHLFRSARAGYVVVGSDIGGYLSRTTGLEQIPFSVDNFLRWTAAMGLVPFFQLHGQGNLTPWTVPDEARRDETVDAYRYWATLHHRLVPFFYSLAEEAYAGGDVIVRPIGDEDEWPGDWRFMVGEAFLVAPILDESGVRDVALPGGARWYDWFALQGAPLEGGVVLDGYDTVETRRIPVFVREGAIVPLRGAGDESDEGLTVLAFPASEGSRFILHEDGDETVVLEAERDGEVARVSLDGALDDVTLKVRAESAPSAVTLDGAPLGGHGYDDGERMVVVPLPRGSGRRVVEVR